MNGRKKPRVPRIIRNPIERAMLCASRFTEAELAFMLGEPKAAFEKLRAGVAGEWDWQQLASAVSVALSIEHKRVVRGLLAHLQAADQALAGIRKRAMASGQWQPTALYFQELDALQLLLELHEFQLRQLSAGEFRAAFNHAVGETKRAGGTVIHAATEAEHQLRLAA